STSAVPLPDRTSIVLGRLRKKSIGRPVRSAISFRVSIDGLDLPVSTKKIAVRLTTSPATWPRLNPASWRACLTVPGLISTPRHSLRRPEVLLSTDRVSPLDGCDPTADMTPA